MPSTVSGIIDIVRVRVNHSALSDLQVLDLINTTQRIYQRRLPIEWQRSIATQQTVSTVTAALQTFTLPSDYKAIDAVYAIISGEHRLIDYDSDFFGCVNEFAAATAAQKPTRWSLYGGSGYFFPALSTALTAQVFYHSQISDFTAVTGTSNFLTTIPEVLEFGAAAEYYDSIFETDKAQVFHAKARGAMDAFIQQQRDVQELPRTPIPVTPGTIKVRNRRSNTRGYTWW